MGDLLITVAPTGAETSKDDCPQLPTTLEELAKKNAARADLALVLPSRARLDAQ